MAKATTSSTGLATYVVPIETEPADRDVSRRDTRPSIISGHPVNLNSFALPDFFVHGTQDIEPLVQEDHCGSQWVIKEGNLFRALWSSIIFLLLAYTASIYLYRFTFWHFHIGLDGPKALGENYLGWVVIDKTADILFWLDLLLNFFISYKDDRGKEVDSLRRIAINYLKGFFWVNLIACSPDLIGEIVLASGEIVDLRVARISRLQRMSRLTRLMRLTRLIKCFSERASSPLLVWLSSLRGVRIVNFIFGLLWSIHLLACGWYLCAALHQDVAESWVARRLINSSGDSLLSAPPQEQWLHSMYFVLTVFTTVGFGDISAGTEAEIFYVAFTMVSGTVVHSIIISEVITIVTSTDRMSQFIEKQLNIVEAFCEHTQLPRESHIAIKDEIKYRARSVISSIHEDKEQMKELITTGKYIPRWLLGSLPGKMFQGRILRNQLLMGNLYLPPRLPCLLAVNLHQSQFEAGEIVYQMHDFPFNLFMVLRGTFAHVAMPTENGGMDMPCEGIDPGVRAVGSNAQKNKISKSGILSSLAEMASTKPEPRERTSSGSAHPEDGAVCTENLYPYRLIGCNSYFGDVELLRSRPRLSTVRCESATSWVLVLHKTGFAELKDQFPQFAALWGYAARGREWTRMKQLARCKIGLPYRAIAALHIQRIWRSLPRRQSNNDASNPLGEERVQGSATGPDSASIHHAARWSAVTTKKRYINSTSLRFMDRQEVSCEGGHATVKLQKRVDKLSEEVGGLREDVRAIMQALNIQRSPCASAEPDNGGARGEVDGTSHAGAIEGL